MDMDQRREHWRVLIDQQARSGQSIRAWCEANGIKQGQYYSWKSRLRAPSPQSTGNAGSFIPLELPSPGTLSIDFGLDIHVEVSGDCSLDHLRATLEVLRGSSRCWR